MATFSSGKAQTKRFKNQEQQCFWQFNKYLQILGLKITEMTNELEDLRKFQHLPKPSRSRYRLNRGQDHHHQVWQRRLERIIHNLQEMNATKRKVHGHRLATVVEVIEILTKQVMKCTENFQEVRAILTTRKSPSNEETVTANTTTITSSPRMENKCQQTDVQKDNEKSYNDWICEMRNTNNGQKFLDKVSE